jgi:hypothetical protein
MASLAIDNERFAVWTLDLYRSVSGFVAFRKALPM